MIEGPVILARILRDWRVSPLPERTPIPVAHLTVRARDGIHLNFEPR
jgi:hypothetical protein